MVCYLRRFSPSFLTFSADTMSLLGLSRQRSFLHHIFFASYRLIHGNNTLPIPPALTALETPEDTDKARSWIAKFKDATIPRSHVELHFARSSGPGGQVKSTTLASFNLLTRIRSIQNVNKVNTKAIIKCPLNSSWIPAWARAELLRSVSAYSTLYAFYSDS